MGPPSSARSWWSWPTPASHRGSHAPVALDRQDELDRRGELGTYLEGTAEAGIADRVLFTGYLTHDRLRHLFARMRRGGGIVADVAEASVATLEAAADLGPLLRDHVERRHDWRAVARRLHAALDEATAA